MQPLIKKYRTVTAPIIASCFWVRGKSESAWNLKSPASMICHPFEGNLYKCVIIGDRTVGAGSRAGCPCTVAPAAMQP